MRLAPRLTRLAGTLPYILAVGTIGLAYLSPSGAAARPTPVVSRAAACKSLPVSKQVQAVKDFAVMLPVFRHARCIRCHGGLDLLSDAHPGKGQVEDADPADRESYLAVCQNCHDGMKGWRLPGDPLFFTGKDDEDLCRQMKQFEKTGEDFVDHIRHDHGVELDQFIRAAFVGDRALGPEGLTENDLVAEPPPGTQAEMTQQAQKWVDDLEGHYADSPECGCVVPRIKLEVHNVLVMEDPNGLPSKEASDLTFEVNLLPMGEDKPGAYQGDVDVVRRVQVTVPGNCSVAGNTINEHWTFYGILKPDSDSIQVWHIQMSDDPEGEVGCKVTASGGWGTRRLSGKTEIVKTQESWTQSILANAEPFMMPSDSGAAKEFTDGEAGDPNRESLTITVLAIPE